jgi:hypothetical protein
MICAIITVVILGLIVGVAIYAHIKINEDDEY